jgi:hypothetical protein
LRIASNGNVGIGTTDTTTYKLNVGGTINATSVLVNGAAITASSPSQWSGTTNIFYNGGNVGIGTNNPTTAKLVISGTGGALGLDMSSADQYAEMRVIKNSLWSADKDLYLQIGAGTDSKLRLYSNNAETLTCHRGKVGLGTTNPTNKLEIIHSSTAENSDSGDGVSLYAYNPTNSAGQNSIITNRVGGTSAGKVLYGFDVAGSYGYSIYMNGNSSDLRFNNSWDAKATDVMILKTNGNVGIGTNNPTYKCHLKLSSSTPAGGLHLDVSSVGADEYALTIYANDYGGARVGWLFRTQSQQGGTNIPIELTQDGRVIFSKSISSGGNITTTSGNVGIGTTNPTTARLVISGTDGAIGLDMSSTDQYAEMRVIRNSRGSLDKDLYLQLGAGTDSKIRIYSNNVETLRCHRGSVFIGTTDMPANSMPAPSTTYNSLVVGNIGYGISSGSGDASGIYMGDGLVRARWRINHGNAQMNLFQSNDSGTYEYRGAFANSTGAYSSVSDRRLKKLIQPIQYGLNDVLKLKPVSYLMKNQNEDIDKKNLGLIAQDLEDVIPEVVNISQSNDNITYSIQYSSIIPILIKAVQELNDINIGYENRIKRLESLLNISNNTSNLSVDTQQ